MVISGLLLPRTGEKLLLRGGALLVLIGFWIIGRSGRLWELYLFFGLFGGYGMATVYGISATLGPRIFPRKSGMATGIVVAGLGVGMMLIPVAAQRLIDSCGVIITMHVLGSIFFCLVMLGTLLMKPLPRAGAIKGGRQLAGIWKGVLKNPATYLLMFMMAGGVTSGLMIVSQTAVMAREHIGMDAAVSAYCVSIVAAANTLGRFFWGALSDRLGRFRALIVNFAFSAAMMLLLTLSGAGRAAVFLAGACGVGFAYGGFMSILPPLSSECLGPENNTFKFGVVYIGFAAGGFIGPMMKSLLGGTYSRSFVVAAGISVVCLGVTWALSRLDRDDRMKKAAAEERL